MRKIAEIPFDFVRKRVSVVVDTDGTTLLITKGAFHHVLEICARSADGVVLDDAAKARLEERYEAWSAQGIRVLAVASRTVARQSTYSREVERDLTFVGFLTFFDRPKEDVADAIRSLAALGVAIKIITGDCRPVTQHVAALVGLRDRVLTGADLQRLSDEALWRAAESTDLFVEVDPNQKERIILALKKMGHVVGFLGDGVNDAPAIHAADTSLSVEQAVDVARAAADFVLLEPSLDVICRGIVEGRKTFANTLKYVLTTMSANLGNMISMAGASLFLPFLPLTAGQILLNNLLSDVPAIGIADDAVDPELIERPQRWNRRFHWPLHAGVRDRELDVRLSHVWRAPGGVPSRTRSVQDGMVRRIAADRAGDRVGRTDATALLPKSARRRAALVNRGADRAHLRHTLPAIYRCVRVRSVTRRERSLMVGSCPDCPALVEGLPTRESRVENCGAGTTCPERSRAAHRERSAMLPDGSFEKFR